MPCKEDKKKNTKKKQQRNSEVTVKKHFKNPIVINAFIMHIE